MLSIIYLILIRYKFILKNENKLFLKKSIKLKISLLNLDQYFFIYLDQEYNNKEDIKKMYINDC
jgi:hypothetical protein